MKFTSKTKCILAILSATSLGQTPAQAKIIQYKCISKISELKNELPVDLMKTGSTIAVFDWDDTIVPWDWGKKTRVRKFEEFRESDNFSGTLATLTWVQNLGIQTMILTGRLKGQPLEFVVEHYNQTIREMLDGTVENMLEILGKDQWMKSGPFNKTETMVLDIPGGLSESTKDKDIRRKLHLVAKDHFVFAGGGIVKAKAFKRLLDQNVFINSPSNVIFIDDMEENTDDIAKTFEDAQENFYIYYYPGPNSGGTCSDFHK